MIYRYTNIRGVSNYGVILDHDGDWFTLLMDEFHPTGGDIKIEARYCYVCDCENPVISIEGTREILQSNTPVSWIDDGVRYAASQRVKRNDEEWKEWVREYNDRLMSKYLNAKYNKHAGE